jgi:pimeloyl-ACP methyl ester carboxylesterase
MNGPLYASRGGPDDAPALLLVHPMGADHEFWSDCRRAWESAFRCIAVDLRGVCRSPALSAPRSLEAHAQDLEAFCATEGLTRSVFVGCAVGAMIATVFAARNPGSCDRLVLSNPGYRTTPEARAALSTRAAGVRAEGMAAAREAVGLSFGGHAVAERIETYRRRFLAQDPAAYALQIDGMLDADVSEYLAGIACPTLVVAGGRDVLLPVRHARAVADGLADARLSVIEQAGHFIPYECPDRFAALVTEFIDGRSS